MSTADDLRDLRDALDSIAHGALPRWFKPTTKTGQEAQTAAREVYERWTRALLAEGVAKAATDFARLSEDRHRAHAEALTERCEKAEQERDELRAQLAFLREEYGVNADDRTLTRDALEQKIQVLTGERRQLRARLVECRAWAGCCLYPNTPKFDELMAIRALADDTLEEVKP